MKQIGIIFYQISLFITVATLIPSIQMILPQYTSYLFLVVFIGVSIALVLMVVGIAMILVADLRGSSNNLPKSKWS